MDYSFDRAFNEWSKIPVDELGYFTAEKLINLEPGQLKELIFLSESYRYSTTSWRNLNGTYKKFMKLESVRGKLILDYGCGLGLDALQFVRAGSRIAIADIHPLTLFLAQQTLTSTTSIVPGYLIFSLAHYPWFIIPEKIHMFWSFGVLHHTPYIVEILKKACSVLLPDGEIRIGLYSDKRWTEMMNEPLPINTHEHPRFQEYVRKCDNVGFYADWYNEDKIKELVKDFATITECTYLGKGQMLGVAMRPK